MCVWTDEAKRPKQRSLKSVTGNLVLRGYGLPNDRYSVAGAVPVKSLKKGVVCENQAIDGVHRARDPIACGAGVSPLGEIGTSGVGCKGVLYSCTDNLRYGFPAHNGDVSASEGENSE